MYECLVAVDNLADAENLTAAEEEELKKRVQAQRRRNEEERQINENAKLAEEFDCVGSNLTLVDKDQIVFLSQIGIYFYHKRCFV